MLLQRKKDEAILPSFTELFLCCCCVCVCVCVGTGIGCILFFYVLFLWRNHWFFHFQDGPKQCVRDAGFLWLARFFEKKKKNHLVDERTSVPEFIQRKIWKFRFFFLVSFYSVCLCGIIREKKKRLHLWSKKSSTEWNHFSKIVKKNVVLFFFKKKKMVFYFEEKK